MENRRCITAVPENGELNEVSLIITLAFCLEAISDDEIRSRKRNRAGIKDDLKKGAQGKQVI